MSIKNLKEIISNSEDIKKIKEVFAKEYAKALGIDENKASRIISEKFNKHVGILSSKLQKSITEENVKNIKNDKDVSLDEYLEKKPIIKG